MPTVLRVGPYRVYFFAADRNEPPHVHIRRDRAMAKFWLDPIRLARSYRFKVRELRTIKAILQENEPHLMRAWDNEFRTH
jgi:Domain of unknown function (DUF4160)